MNTNQKVDSITYDIMNGPSADRLFDACRYAYDDATKIPIDFGIAIGYSMPKDDPGCAIVGAHSCDLRIVGIEHEDGSGHSFNIRGYCAGFKKGPYSDPLYVNHKVMIYYNTKTRNGKITFSK